MLLARTILFAVTAVICIIIYGPLGHSDYTGRWGDGTFGVVQNRSSIAGIEDITPGLPAAKAGVHLDDAMIANSINDYTELTNPLAGDKRTFTFQRPDGSRYEATMTAVPVPGFTTWDRITGILATIPATIFLGVAFMLVFLRPNVMTWSFYAYAIGYPSTQPAYEYFYHIFPYWPYYIYSFISATFLNWFAVLPLIPFLVRFPDDKLSGVRKSIDRASWVVLALAFLASIYEWWGYSVWSFGKPDPQIQFLDSWLPLVVFAFALFILVKKTKHASPENQQRFAFLSMGLAISFVAYAIYFVPHMPRWITQVVGYAVVMMPISVAYAVLRHRVLDVNFVLNRALAYGILSIFVIAIVSLLDWTFSRIVSERHLAVVAELGVTICVGFLLDRINKFIEMVVERIFFRSRRAAESYIKKVAAALPYATDEQAVSEGLTQAPGDALRLVAAALYRRSNDGTRFDGIATSLQTPVAPPGFPVNHLLVRMLQSSEEKVWLEEVRNYLDAENSSKYVIAIPITVRHELVSFALYGAHSNGAQLDPDEIELLEELAREASRAYDHIEAVRVREQYAHYMTLAPTGSP